MKDKDRAALDAIAQEIEAFEADLSSKDDPRITKDRETLGEQLELLFDTICDLSQFKRKHKIARAAWVSTDKLVLKVWYAVFAAIENLSSWAASVDAADKTMPHYIAARMLLFLLHAHTHNEALPFDLELSKVSRVRVNLQMAFIFALDEALLAHLIAIWDISGRREDFRWAFTHLGCTKHDGDGDGDDHIIRTDYNRAVVRTLSPAELWQVPGMTGRQHWVANPDDPPIYKGFPMSTMSAFGEGPKESGKAPIVKQTLYSDGPLDSDGQYCLFESDKEEWLRGPRYRRSRQFIMDVRQFMYPRLVEERQRLAMVASTRGELPAELQVMIGADLGRLESPDVHPYLSHLDLASVYAPFPTTLSDDDDEKKECDGCGGEEAGSVKQLTCPSKSIYIWNLPLRAFHVFHLTPKGGAIMCKQGIACTGHHPDKTYAITNQEALHANLNQTIKARCGQDATLDSIGLGAKEHLCPFVRGRRTEEQRAGFKTYGLGWREVQSELAMMGGWKSLEDTMPHEEVDKPYFDEEDGACNSHSRGPVEWSWSRSEDEEKLCRKYLKKLQESW